MKLNFCPECKAELNQTNPTDYICANGHPYWNNPRGSIGVLFIKGDGVLYAVRAWEPQKGKLDMVGGFLDYGESPLDAAIRETHEETGLRLQPGDLKLIGAFTASYVENITTVALVYVCHKWKGEPVAADDVASFEWGPLELIDSDRFAWKSKDLAEVLNAIKF